jgi:hypothetical protein
VWTLKGFTPNSQSVFKTVAKCGVPRALSVCNNVVLYCYTVLYQHEVYSRMARCALDQVVIVRVYDMICYDMIYDNNI